MIQMLTVIIGLTSLQLMMTVEKQFTQVCGDLIGIPIHRPVIQLSGGAKSEGGPLVGCPIKGYPLPLRVIKGAPLIIYFFDSRFILNCDRE